MAELFFRHDEVTYIYDTKLLKPYRLEDNRSVEINSPEIYRNVRLFSAEISRMQASAITSGAGGMRKAP
jgi:hypothetical protein